MRFNAALLKNRRCTATPTDTFGGGAPGAALHGFALDVGAPISLAPLGLPEADLDRAAGLATRNPYRNPREVTREGIRTLLDAAWRGDLPAGRHERSARLTKVAAIVNAECIYLMYQCDDPSAQLVQGRLRRRARRGR